MDCVKFVIRKIMTNSFKRITYESYTITHNRDPSEYQDETPRSHGHSSSPSPISVQRVESVSNMTA